CDHESFGAFPSYEAKRQLEIRSLVKRKLVFLRGVANEMWTAIERLQQGDIVELQSDQKQASEGPGNAKKEFGTLAKFFKKALHTLPPTTTFELLQTPRTRLKIPHQVGSQVVQQTGIQCFNCKGYGHYAKECRKPKRVKDYAYHKEKMMMCKQAEQGVPLQAEQADWLEDTDEEIDEQELEAHYSYMAKIQDVSPEESSSTGQPLEQVDQNAAQNVLIDTCCVANVIANRASQHADTKEKKNDFKAIKESNRILGSSRIGKKTVLLAPKCATYNGRPTFANPRYLKKAQSEKPCLYEIPYDTSDPANRFAPEREETMTLENESRSKLDKETVKPYDYTRQNSLYEIFKGPSLEYLYQLERGKEVRKTMWRKPFVRTKPNIAKNVAFLPVSKSISKSRQVFNEMTFNINQFREIVDQTWFKHTSDYFRQIKQRSSGHDVLFNRQAIVLQSNDLIITFRIKKSRPTAMNRQVPKLRSKVVPLSSK
ncbi:retrovirus-related pol polyprotein from transposon TNT 1-94, partial [Tanacetum coccineum]